MAEAAADDVKKDDSHGEAEGVIADDATPTRNAAWEGDLVRHDPPLTHGRQGGWHGPPARVGYHAPRLEHG